MANIYSKIFPQSTTGTVGAVGEIDFGANGKPQTIVMLHGWGLNHAVWTATAQALSELAEVHCLDLPGHGKSPLTGEGRSPKIGLLQFTIEAIATYIASINTPVTLVGWSLGGHIAMHIALRHPERIAKLILVCATPCFRERDDWPHAMADKSLQDFSRRLQADQAATIRSFLCLQMLNLPNAKTVAQTLSKQLAVNGHASADALGAWLAVLEQSDIRNELLKLSATQILITQGGRDMLVPVATGDWLAQTLPHAQYLRIAAAAHAPFISHGEIFLSAVKKFISGDAVAVSANTNSPSFFAKTV
jgi:pimeloyl-[acyl-carrier protein] methyl ester esterase